MANDKHCAGCVYYRCVYSGPDRCCCYIFMTNQKRPCPPGKDCTVKVPYKEKKWSREVKNACKAKKQPSPVAGRSIPSEKNGVICCQSSLVDCGYSAGMLKELRAAGFELYKDDKKLWRARA